MGDKNLKVVFPFETEHPEMMNISPVEKGGEGSGFHGHAGRPGKQGGSLPTGEGGSRQYRQDMPDYEFKPGIGDVHSELVNAGIEEFSVTEDTSRAGGFGKAQYIKLTQAGSRKIDDLEDGVDTIMKKAGFSRTHESSGWTHYRKGNSILSVKVTIRGNTGATYKRVYTIASLG